MKTKAIFLNKTLCLCSLLTSSFITAFVYKNFEVLSAIRRYCKDNLNNNYGYEYCTTVDLRIIVMTFNRPQSMLKTLTSLNSMHTDGAVVSLHIWIDIDKNGIVDSKTMEVATNFQFARGTKTVHVHTNQAGIFGQWVYTWRPKLDTDELALLLEDDITISPYAWRWLKLVHSKYKHWNRVAGYSLQCEQLSFVGVRKALPLGPEDLVYAFRVIGTWGFAPHPKSWREFQDWVFPAKHDGFFKPFVDGIIPTQWYKSFEQRNYEHSMWEMWHICFTHFNNLLTLYAHFPLSQLLFNTSDGLLRQGGHCLSVNRQEMGLHFSTGEAVSDNRTQSLLLSSWPNSFESIPNIIRKFDYNGQQM